MKRVVCVARAHEHGLGVHLLVIEVIADQAVKLVGARFRRAHHLDGAAPAVLDRIGVDLNARLLDGVGIRRQVQDALPDTTGDVETVDDELVGHRPLAVRADVHGRFRGVVVDARSGCAGAARLAASHRAESGYAGRQGREGDEVAAGERQRRQRVGLQRHLIPRLRGIHERRFRADGHLLGHGADLENHRHVQGLIGLEDDAGFVLAEACGLGGQPVRSRRQAEKPETARGVGRRGGGNPGGQVDGFNRGVRNRRAAGILHDAGDVARVLGGGGAARHQHQKQ